MNPKLSLVIGVVCISFSPIFVKLVDASPVICSFYRIFFAWVLLLPYCLYKGNLKMQRKDILLAMVGGLVFASDIAVWNLSIKLISATVSTLVANLAPVWVGLLSWIILRKRSGWLFWMGTGIAIIGMVILVGLSNLINLQLNIGIVYAVASSMLYAVYILTTKDILRRISTVPFMFYNMLAAGVFLLLLSLFLGDSLFNYTPKTWAHLAAMGIVCQLIGWITINNAISHLESTKVSISLLSQTVVTGLLAVALLGERLTLTEAFGGILVLAGIAITFLKPKKTSAL